MIDTKTKQIFFILEEVHKRKDRTIDSYDDILSTNFGLSPKQIGRLLKEISDSIDTFMPVKIGKRTAYKLMKPLDIFTEAFKNSTEIHQLIHMAHDADPEVFDELALLTKSDQHIYMFKNSPFEDTKTLSEKETFQHLKDAVSRREYRKITFQGDSQDKLKCLKLIYMENNWYIAYVNDEDKLLFGRISFIQKVEYASKDGAFQPSSVTKHLTFLKNDLQNAMTLYDSSVKTAHIQVSPDKAHYFEKQIKVQMPSQKFKEKREDGSIIFTVEYTQPLEILPFLYKWIPHFKILEPKKLKNVYVENLQKSLKI